MRFDDEPGCLYVGRLATPPVHRGKGVAGALMAHAEERAVALGRQVVRVEVRSALPGNIAMFERLGFVQVAIQPHPKMLSATTVTLEKSIRNDLDRTMAIEVHQLLADLPRFDFQTGRKDMPKNGVYVFYERGETANVGVREIDRIVRIGTHRALDRLPIRVRSHFAGNRRGSVFRRHLGGALMSRIDADDPDTGEWAKQRGRLMPAMEQIVSTALNGSFTFTCIRVDDRDERLSLERGLIALLARRPLVAPSQAWLGRHAIHPFVRQSGLWNTQHVDAQPLTLTEFDRLWELIRETGH